MLACFLALMASGTGRYSHGVRSCVAKQLLSSNDRAAVRWELGPARPAAAAAEAMNWAIVKAAFSAIGLITELEQHQPSQMNPREGFVPYIQLKTFLFCKSFPLQPFFGTNYMIPQTFTVTSSISVFTF